MAPTVVLVTGGNRGLGEGLVKRYLAAPNHTVIAAVRNPTHSTAEALTKLPKGEGSSLIIAKCDSAVESDAANLVKELETKHGITYIDVVIANAGIAKSYPLVKDVTRAAMQEHFDINLFAVISLFQATRPLLQKSQAPNKPIFAPMGSGAGALGRQPPVPNAAYAPSKAVINWFGVRINAEEPWLNAFVLDPGWVQTEIGNTAAVIFGMEKAITEVDDSCDGMFKLLNNATKEKYGGRCVLFDGEPQIW